MFRWLAAVALATILPMTSAHAQTEQQALVDRATLTIQDMMANNPSKTDMREMLRRAKGAMVCPQIFKAGFIFGGQGGGCVLVGRTATGWSGPAFYGLGSASVGFQAGIQDSQILFVILTEHGLRALLDDQFKIGAGGSVAFATVGVGVDVATTAAFDADIIAFQSARGLFAGISLDGSLIGTRSDWNAAYYGQPLAPQQIVVQGVGQNPGAAPLAEMLSRAAAPAGYAPSGYAQAPQPPYAAAQAAPYPQAQSYPQNAPYQGQAPMPLAPGASGAVQSAPLPPPRR